MMSRTYEIIDLGGLAGQAIKCLVCGRTSHSQGDVDNLWCHGCGKFHSDLEREQRGHHPKLTVLSRNLAHSLGMEMDDGMDEFSMESFIEDYIKSHHVSFQEVLDEEVKPKKSVVFAKMILKFIS